MRLFLGANFTAYQEIKKLAHKFQPELTDLPSYQHMVIGLISGAMGPFSNAPIDTIKTRSSPAALYTIASFLPSLITGLQRATAIPGQSAFQRIANIAGEMWKQEGVRSFYKGITPRVLRVAPGQAIVFAVYERVRKVIENMTPRHSDESEERYSE